MTVASPRRSDATVSLYLGEFQAPYQRRPYGVPRGRTVQAPAGVRPSALVFALISATLMVLVVNLTLVSQLVHYTEQHALYSSLRLSLAQGATPIGPLDVSGNPVSLGTPVAFMSAGSIGLSREVIVQGTGSAQTMDGVGHRRDTVMPCQSGSSVLMARSGSYGAVGHSWSMLHPGDTLTITMGQGTCTYRVRDLRRAGDYEPAPPTPGTGRLVLTTADGRPFFPNDVLRIDADSTTRTYPAAAATFPSASLPASENAMSGDTGQLVSLTLYLLAIVLLAIAAAWMWRRWNHAAVRLTLIPLIGLFALLAANSTNLLLPNLL